MNINEKYLIDKLIETLKDDPEYNTGSLVWWYSDSLDIMQPCRMGTAPDLGVDDWELVVVSQDLEYYLPNDSSTHSFKRKSGPHPWVSSKEGLPNDSPRDISKGETVDLGMDTSKKDSKTNKFEILIKQALLVL